MCFANILNFQLKHLNFRSLADNYSINKLTAVVVGAEEHNKCLNNTLS